MGQTIPNTQDTIAAIERLQMVLSQHAALAIAVSGGVDSMTLAMVAHSLPATATTVVHAVSPAVPSAATDRVKCYADKYLWSLKIVDAGEFSDPRYRKNPVNRCYYCKTNLYSRLQEVYQGPLASGANLDDLSDYRPGLEAASEHAVIHPLVMAQINKNTVRAIARHLKLPDLADLPAQPCLSSRVETGIAISSDDLFFIHRVEKHLLEKLGVGDVRCRVTSEGVRIEVAQELIDQSAGEWPHIQGELETLIAEYGQRLVGFSDYQRGSAFLV